MNDNSAMTGATHHLASVIADVGPLRYAESNGEYSTYLTVTPGEVTEVYLAHGTGQRLYPFEELLETYPMEDRWTDYLNGRRMVADTRAWEFLHDLEARVIDPENVTDWFGVCDGCYYPADKDDMVSVNNGNLTYCDGCIGDHTSRCYDCEERFTDVTTTLTDVNVCEGCRGANWSYCDWCEGYRSDEDWGHDHDDSDRDEDGSSCESPAQQFTVRNDGQEPLANDVRVTVSMPSGFISDEGLDSIAAAVRNHAYSAHYANAETPNSEVYPVWCQFSYQLADLGDQWQTKDGNYAKRASRLAYKAFSLKIPPDLMSTIGTIAREHSTGVEFGIEVTRDLNQSAEEFAHEDSCWWQSYSNSRCALKTNGGFGLRSFKDDEYQGVGGQMVQYTEVTGRAWVLPLKIAPGTTDFAGRPVLVPTFETMEPDAFMVFNGYGDLSGYAAARIVSHMAGMTYRKIGFSCSPMYVNSNSGYLIAPESLAEPFTDGAMSLSVPQHATLFEDEQAASNTPTPSDTDNEEAMVLTNA